MKVIIKDAPPAAREYLHSKIHDAKEAMGLQLTIEFSNTSENSSKAESELREEFGKMLAEAHNLLHSALTVAKREGGETYWEGFRERLGDVLERQLEFMNAHGIESNFDAPDPADIWEIPDSNASDEPPPVPEALKEFFDILERMSKPGTFLVKGSREDGMKILAILQRFGLVKKICDIDTSFTSGFKAEFRIPKDSGIDPSRINELIEAGSIEDLKGYLTEKLGSPE